MDFQQFLPKLLLIFSISSIVGFYYDARTHYWTHCCCLDYWVWCFGRWILWSISETTAKLLAWCGCCVLACGYSIRLRTQVEKAKIGTEEMTRLAFFDSTKPFKCGCRV